MFFDPSVMFLVHTRREAHLQDVGIGQEIKWSLELQSYQLRIVGDMF